MASNIIPVVSTAYEVVPEGHYVFTIDKVVNKMDFGYITITFKSGDYSQSERYTLTSNDGTTNDQAARIFSLVVKKAMNDDNITSIDLAKLPGRQIEADIVHSTKDGKTYAHLRNIASVQSDNAQVPTDEAKPSALADLLK